MKITRSILITLLFILCSGFSANQLLAQPAPAQLKPVEPLPPVATGKAEQEKKGNSKTDVKKPDAISNDPKIFDVSTTDNSNIRVTILDSTVELVTRYGKLNIPVSDIRNIEICKRISDADKTAIDLAISQLSDGDRKIRIEGRESIVKLGPKALPALRRVKKNLSDAEISSSIANIENQLLMQKNDTQEPEQLEQDIIDIEGSRFVGLIANKQIKVLTGPFGEQQLKITDVRKIVSTSKTNADDEGELVTLTQNNLMEFARRFGKVYRIQVTGAQRASIYGTGTYTLDSDFATAAVHSGVLKFGESGIVTVKIVPSPMMFTGSQQNGIMSSQYSQYEPGGFEIITKKNKLNNQNNNPFQGQGRIIRAQGALAPVPPVNNK